MSAQANERGPRTRPPVGDPPTRRSPADLIELSRGQSAGQFWDITDLAAMWRHQLGASVKGEIKLLHDQSDFPPETSFADLLLRDANPSADHLRAVKDYAKTLERDPHQPLPSQIVWLLYLLAVCAADQRCKTRISSTAADALAKWAGWAIAQPWLDNETRAMISTWRPST